MVSPPSPTDKSRSAHRLVDKQETEMFQIEFYLRDVEHICRLFETIFDFTRIEDKPNWRQIRHKAHFDLLLFTPDTHELPAIGTAGKGIEFVICTPDISRKR